MLKSFFSQPHIAYFSLYSVTFLTYGALLSGLGPLIPFLSQRAGIAETEYSYLFSSRAFSIILGGFITKWLQRKQVDSHNIIILGSLVIGVISGLFSMAQSHLWLGLWLCLSCIGYSLLEITLNVCVMMASPPGQLSFWMLVTHGFIGVGGFIGPMIVYLFQEHSFLVYGLLSLLSIPFYAKIKSPKKLQVDINDKVELKQVLFTTEKQEKIAPKSLEYSLCFLMFIQLGIQISFGGWISSFAVMTGVTNNQGATFLSSIHWITMTVAAFLLIFVGGSSSRKLGGLIKISLFAGVSSLWLIFIGLNSPACYSSSVLFGIATSSMLPLILTFPVQQGLKLKDEQVSNIMMAVGFSEGFLTMLVGKLMNLNINFFFYCMVFFSLAMWVTHKYCLQLINKEKILVKNTFFSMQLKDMGNTATTAQPLF